MNFFGTTIWTPQELQQAQQDLASIAQGTDVDVRACDKVSAGDKTAWSNFYASLTAFTAQNVHWLPDFWASDQAAASGTRADQLQEYQRELLSWQQKLSVVCKLTSATISPGKPPKVGDYANLLKWGVLGVTAVGGFWLAGKLFELVPRRRTA